MNVLILFVKLVHCLVVFEYFDIPGSKIVDFVYVPSHIEHILFEVFKVCTFLINISMISNCINNSQIYFIAKYQFVLEQVWQLTP